MCPGSVLREITTAQAAACIFISPSLSASESGKSGSAAAAGNRATAALCPPAKPRMMAGIGEREEGLC